jgi:hypothetical protein
MYARKGLVPLTISLSVLLAVPQHSEAGVVDIIIRIAQSRPAKWFAGVVGTYVVNDAITYVRNY